MNVDFEKYLQLEDDLRRYRKALNEALEIMLDQEVSNYPIFIIHQQELETVSYTHLTLPTNREV